MNRREYKIEELRKNLLASSNELFMRNKNPKLLTAIRSKFPNISRAFVINWICEQGEDLYTLVVGNDSIVEVEISRVNKLEEPLIEIFSVSAYLNKHPFLTKVSKRSLTQALALIKEGSD